MVVCVCWWFVYVTWWVMVVDQDFKTALCLLSCSASFLWHALTQIQIPKRSGEHYRHGMYLSMDDIMTVNWLVSLALHHLQGLWSTMNSYSCFEVSIKILKHDNYQPNTPTQTSSQTIPKQKAKSSTCNHWMGVFFSHGTFVRCTPVVRSTCQSSFTLLFLGWNNAWNNAEPQGTMCPWLECLGYGLDLPPTH